MKVTSSILMALAVTAELAAAQSTATAEDGPLQPPIKQATSTGERTSQGCFKGKGDWDFIETSPMSSGACHGPGGADSQPGVCVLSNKKYTVSALTPDGCYCGFNYPPKSDLVDDKFCDTICPAWDKEACGGFTDGKTYYSVYNIGIKIAVPNKAEGSTSSTTSSATESNAPAATSDQALPAASSKSPEEDSSDDGAPSVGGIVGGVVAGVVVAGIIGSIIFFVWRRKRNQSIEEEHRRNATVNSFISGAKPPSSSGVSMTDSRMDPGMAHQRRLSDGSIADNQDYSRKILRVTNA